MQIILFDERAKLYSQGYKIKVNIDIETYQIVD
jgi:hypothetical protein